MKSKVTVGNLPVYQPGKPIEEVKKQYNLKEVIKLASNENPWGCSPAAKEAMRNEIEHSSLYPDGGSVALNDAVSSFIGVKPEQLIFGAGSDEVILMICRAFLNPGDETIMATPTFPQYKHNAAIEGAIIHEVPLKDGVHDLDGMLALVNENTKIIWICNPNNPTGTIVNKQAIEKMFSSIPSSCLIVLDEAYSEYIEDEDYADSKELLSQYPNLIVTRTFSKIYGLAAHRIGFGIGQPDMIRLIQQVREPFNTTRMAQAAAIAAIEDQAFIKACADSNRMGLIFLQDHFDKMGLKYFPAFGNFIMVDVKQPAGQVFESLMRQGIIVRGGHQLGYPTHLRVTVGQPHQNEAFIKALQEALASNPVS